MTDRVLQAQQFAAHVQKYGGATMNVRTGAILPPGKRAYVVGGEPDLSGQRIPTKYVPSSEFGHEAVLSHWQHLAANTRGKNVNLGAWSDNGNVELDASRSVKRPREAIRKGSSRGEKAVWDNGRMTEIDTSSAKSAARVAKDLG